MHHTVLPHAKFAYAGSLKGEGKARYVLTYMTHVGESQQAVTSRISRAFGSL